MWAAKIGRKHKERTEVDPPPSQEKEGGRSFSRFHSLPEKQKVTVRGAAVSP